ncbi:GFA family protein [Thalassotalea sp. M1531]|uniref:GFA family protein n=1 Tax=Thalassotalea algicola TaxID=2716224 RepID=A0A7Y0L8V9_9GAMM|nr:GFA family protein [Thalassotalea algicola]NMP30103.1 GFA family protein [Thalassotalea algicola]
MNKGSCLCGAIIFEVAKFQPLIGHCHCSMCRKFHGAAFSTFGEVKREHLQWISGVELLSHFHARNDTTRSFCRHCGSSLLFESKFNREAATVEIALAAFDDIDDVNPDAHIYTESKVSWIALSDNLPKYKGYREI